MCRVQQNNLNVKQYTAIASLMCFIVVSFLAEAFIAAYTYHEHDLADNHSVCPVCIQLQIAENLLKYLRTTVAIEVSVFTGLLFIIEITQFAVKNIILLTPVALKIRMNN